MHRSPLSLVAPMPDEMAAARSWFEANLGPRAAPPPFSFRYDGRPSGDLLPAWKAAHASRDLDQDRAQQTLTYTDPKTSLQVRCVVVRYKDFPTVEWTLYLKNTGAADTPILEDVQGMDVRFERGPEAEFLLHHNVGSPCRQNDYQPLETPLGPGAKKRITGFGGRPTNSDLSYFNVEWSGRGVIAVVGWPGQWAAQFARDDADGLRIRAGQELTHLRLHPGEEIRTPLIVLQFWKGDWIRSQNIWRRWMLAHNLPRPGGRPVPTHFASCHGNMQPRASEEIEQIDGWVREGIRLDYWFLDAGWYPGGGSHVPTGTWEPDIARFPQGLRGLADHAHAKGMKFVVWFEPERVQPGTWLWEKHPEWLLGCADERSTTPEIGAGRKGPHRLLNLGHPEARRWLIDHYSRMIAEHGIDCYRQDFNINPLTYWRENDAGDRQGITENAYVTGYLAFWDELLRRHPDLLIDTCASGGRRNDLETLRRSVPLLRSDHFTTPVGQQCQTYGISLWMPYYGSGTGFGGPYVVRSSICPAFRIGCDTRKRDADYDLLRRMVREFRKMAPYLLGDFYPLTPYSLESNAWMAWQFDRPEEGGGVVQAFRRPESPDDSVRLKLRGLDPEARYALTDLDTNTAQEIVGRELMDEGLPIRTSARPASAVVIYKKAK